MGNKSYEPGSAGYQSNQLERSPDYTLQRDKMGLWTCTQIYHCRRENLGAYAPTPGTVHPVFDWLYVDSIPTIKGLENDDWCRLEVVYAGARSLGEDAEEVDNPPEYSLEVSTSEEPIETHPYFVDTLSEEDIREAVELARNPPREEDGTLSTVDQTGWAAKKSELYDSVLQGVEAYKDPKATWTMRWVSDAKPADLNTVGKIETPTGSPPTAATGRNWINAGLRSTERGIVFENEKVWELSGRGGWNTNWYT